jgi:hypothetical protein
MTSDQKIKEVIQTLDQVLDKNKTQFEKFGLATNKPSQKQRQSPRSMMRSIEENLSKIEPVRD